MKIPYEFQHCILCLENPPNQTNWEHIIPVSLGGRLQARTLCKSCNSKMGVELIGALKHTPEIRFALEYLKANLPALYSRLYQSKAEYSGVAPDGSLIRLSGADQQGYQVLDAPGANDSFIQDTAKAVATLDKILIKNKVNQADRARFKQLFTDLENDCMLTVPGGYTFVKHPLPPLHPGFHPSQELSDRLPVLIAYEFLAVLIGNSILDESLNEIARYIALGAPSTAIEVARLQGGETYDTFHALTVERDAADLNISVRLFRWLTYRVTFHNLLYRVPECIYLEDLFTQQSYFAISRSEAELGLWHVLP